MSKIADDVYIKIKQLFPYDVVLSEYYVYYKGTRLFFDFFIKNLGILIECQGEQHFKFNKHFHSSKEAFYGQKRRDNLKVEYTERKKELTLVYFYDTVDKITNELILNRIYEALDK
jgi:hypothetical protein